MDVQPGFVACNLAFQQHSLDCAIFYPPRTNNTHSPTGDGKSPTCKYNLKPKGTECEPDYAPYGWGMGPCWIEPKCECVWRGVVCTMLWIEPRCEFVCRVTSRKFVCMLRVRGMLRVTSRKFVCAQPVFVCILGLWRWRSGTLRVAAIHE